jgi:hypothetical protein
VTAIQNKKRLLRVSLRTFLALFTCVAFGIAWFANYAQKRKTAFAAVREAGGDIQMGIRESTRLEKWFGPEVFGVVIKIDLRDGAADNELLRHIANVKELRRLDLSNADIDDDGLRLIKHLPLKELWLQETKITNSAAETISRMKTLDFLQLNATSVSDAFFEQLQAMPDLEDLGLRGTQVTSAGMTYLSRHPQLKTLDLYSTEVDDGGVGFLVDCQSLQNLGLSMTGITDAVFEHLNNLPNLTDADLSGNRSVTTAAVLAFEKSHAKCDIEWYRK